MKEFCKLTDFSEDLTKVLLAKHQTINGIGGAFNDDDENHKVVALRELARVSALKPNDISEFHELGGIMRPPLLFHWTGMVKPDAVYQSLTDERVSWYDVKDIGGLSMEGELDVIIRFAVKEWVKLRTSKIPEIGQINLEYVYDSAKSLTE